jgi:hypothetical protein
LTHLESSFNSALIQKCAFYHPNPLNEKEKCAKRKRAQGPFHKY